MSWKCETCVETNEAERDPERPDFCKSCPECYSVRWETRRQIVIVAYNDGHAILRRYYRRDEAGSAAAARCVERFAQDGYPLRVEAV